MSTNVDRHFACHLAKTVIVLAADLYVFYDWSDLCCVRDVVSVHAMQSIMCFRSAVSIYLRVFVADLLSWTKNLDLKTARFFPYAGAFGQGWTKRLISDYRLQGIRARSWSIACSKWSCCIYCKVDLEMLLLPAVDILMFCAGQAKPWIQCGSFVC